MKNGTDRRLQGHAVNYDNILCRRVADVPPSGIRKFFDVVSEMEGVISLGVGEPDFNTPWTYTGRGHLFPAPAATPTTPATGA